MIHPLGLTEKHWRKGIRKGVDAVHCLCFICLCQLRLTVSGWGGVCRYCINYNGWKHWFRKMETWAVIYDQDRKVKITKSLWFCSRFCQTMDIVLHANPCPGVVWTFWSADSITRQVTSGRCYFNLLSCHGAFCGSTFQGLNPSLSVHKNMSRNHWTLDSVVVREKTWVSGALNRYWIHQLEHHL